MNDKLKQVGAFPDDGELPTDVASLGVLRESMAKEAHELGLKLAQMPKGAHGRNDAVEKKMILDRRLKKVNGALAAANRRMNSGVDDADDDDRTAPPPEMSGRVQAALLVVTAILRNDALVKSQFLEDDGELNTEKLAVVALDLVEEIEENS